MQESTSKKLQEIAENIPKAYEAGIAEGKKAEYDAFWDTFQQNGDRDNYYRCFYGEGWTNENLKPKYDIVPDKKSNNTSSGTNMFTNMSKFYGSLKDVFDRRGVKLDTSYIREPSGMFDGATNVTEVPHIDISSSRTNASALFYGTSITKVTVTLPDRDLKFTNCFRASKLEEVEITGVLRGTDISFQWSPNLTHESLVHILNVLGDKSTDTSGTAWIITLGSTNKAKLTEEELNIAYNKGWEVQ